MVATQAWCAEGVQHGTERPSRCSGERPDSAATSVRDRSFENQLVILGRSISTRARSKYLNEAPAIPRMLANLLLILDFRRAPRTQPTFAEPDKLVFIFWFHNRQVRTCRLVHSGSSLPVRGPHGYRFRPGR